MISGKDLDFYLNNYEFELPEDLIAQHPRIQRSSSRLMLLDKKTGQCFDKNFVDIVDLLPDNSLLVMNSSKVFPARIKGVKERTKGIAEFLLLSPVPLLEVKNYNNNWCYANINGLIKPAKKIKENQWIYFSDKLRLHVLYKKDFGQINGELVWKGDLMSLLNELGSIPLPPYINREESQEDKERYQTVYANDEDAGSVAAPTAGLHFTEDVFSGLRKRNIDFANISLYIGYDTFAPIRTKDIRNHHMHAEYFEIPEKSAEKINLAIKNNTPVVAVGTTTVRALEGVYNIKGSISGFQGWTDIFIYPGFEFKVVDHILTNFHLPKSSLLIMMSAFAGRENMLQAYEKAVKMRYRFFSYGDAMLVL